MAQENSARGGRKPLIALLAGVPLLCLLIVFALPLLDLKSSGNERVVSGVTLGGAGIGGRGRPALDEDIARYAERVQARKLRIVVANKRYELAPKDVGLVLDRTRTRERALAIGRDGGVWARTVNYWQRRSHSVEVSGVATLDRNALGQRLAAWEGEAVPDPPFEGGIAVANGAVTEVPPKAGHRIARAGAEQAIDAALVGQSDKDVILPLEPAQAPLPPDAATAAVTEARALLAAPVTLTSTAPAASVTLAPAELGSALTTERTDGRLRLTFRAERLAALLDAVRKSVEFEPVDAKFEVSPAGAISIVPGHPGLRVELDRVPDALRAAAASPTHGAELPLAQRPDPALTNDRAATLGIRGLVSSFTTRHPCCEKRVLNIHHIADLLDGRIVMPGETVSVNALVGPRTLKSGFVPAPTIEEGEMVDSVGGGISQFATTFFNALFHGGYDIIERQPHSYWFPRYPMGHEATLSWPKPDIIFRNDTAAGLLIKTSYTDTSITVKLYGDNGGRKIKGEVSARENIVPAPLEIIPNPGVTPDKEHVKEPGSIGWSVIVSRVITFPDGSSKKEQRRVTYKARTRRVEVHPCRIPEGERGYTGQPCPVPASSDAPSGTHSGDDPPSAPSAL
jgi:vancomycin resistance protein YoaR